MRQQRPYTAEENQHINSHVNKIMIMWGLVIVSLLLLSGMIRIVGCVANANMPSPTMAQQSDVIVEPKEDSLSRSQRAANRP